MGTRHGKRLWARFWAKQWSLTGGETVPEVWIAAEGLARGAADVMGSLLHEAAHGRCSTRGEEDCNAARYQPPCPGADAVEDQQYGRVRHVVGSVCGGRSAGAPHRVFLAVGVSFVFRWKNQWASPACRRAPAHPLPAVVDLDEQQRHPVPRGGQNGARPGAVLARARSTCRWRAAGLQSGTRRSCRSRWVRRRRPPGRRFPGVPGRPVRSGRRPVPARRWRAVSPVPPGR